MKVLSIIFGIVSVIIGVYCLFTPVQAYAVIGWIIGIAMLVEGIGSVATWNARRQAGFADGWTLAGAIISIVLGIFLLCSYFAQWAIDVFIAYLIAAWLVVGGITRIVAAFNLRKYNETMGADAIGVNWGVLLALGILVTILGVLCLFNPLSVMMGVGFMIGISIICVGVDLIVRGFRA